MEVFHQKSTAFSGESYTTEKDRVGSSPLAYTKVLATHVTSVSFEEQIDTILSWARQSLSKVVCVANVHMLMEAVWHSDFQAQLNSADLITPDGMPLVKMIRLLGNPDQDRVAGMEIFHALCSKAETQNIKIFLLGSNDSTLTKMRKKISVEYPDLEVCAKSLPFRALTEDEDEEIVNTINNSNVGLVFVALGCPKQEKWIVAHKNRVRATMLGLGYVFQAYAGDLDRAPESWQKNSFEWLFRLKQEPQRLWKRYALTIPPFLILAGTQLIKHKFKPGNSPGLWLAIIICIIFILQLSLFHQLDQGRLYESFLLFSPAVLYLLWERREKLNLKSGLVASLTGTLLLVACFIKAITLGEYDPFLRILPLLSALSLGLIASGFRGLLQYYREFLLMFFLAPSPSLIGKVWDISPWSANLAESILYYSGHSVQREGIFIYLPQGAVEVYYGCSGIETVIHLLGISLILISLFPMTLSQKIILPFIGMFIAFFVNGFRIALLALLAHESNKAVFEYWHAGDGSLIFSLISVLLFGLFFYFYFFEKDEDAETSTEDSKLLEDQNA